MVVIIIGSSYFKEDNNKNNLNCVVAIAGITFVGVASLPTLNVNFALSSLALHMTVKRRVDPVRINNNHFQIKQNVFNKPILLAIGVTVISVFVLSAKSTVI
jgi:hypothetical protein